MYLDWNRRLPKIDLIPLWNGINPLLFNLREIPQNIQSIYCVLNSIALLCLLFSFYFFSSFHFMAGKLSPFNNYLPCFERAIFMESFQFKSHRTKDGIVRFLSTEWERAVLKLNFCLVVCIQWLKDGNRYVLFISMSIFSILKQVI